MNGGPSPRTLRIIEITGWTLFAFWGGTLIAWGIAKPDPYADGWRLVLELAFLGGRAVNIADGVASGFSRAYLLFQCGLQDVVYTFIVYPWIVRIYRGVARVGVLGKALVSLRRSAEKNARYIEPLGGFGLWLFVFFPFWSTGVLNGAALGFILGMRTSVNLAIVLSAHIVCVIALLGFFQLIAETLRISGSPVLQYLPWIVVGILLTALMVTQLVRRALRKK